MSKKQKFNESDLGTNPLVTDEFVVKLRRIKSKYILKDDLRSEIEGTVERVEVSHYTMVEQESFTKVYNRSAFRLHIMNLSLKASKLYLWIIYELDPGKDYIWFNRDRIKKELGISDNTYRRAIKELQTAIIILPSIVKDIYWINPDLIFHGSRKDKYPEHLQITN